MHFARLWLNRPVPSRHTKEAAMPVPVETPYGPMDAVADWLRANDIDPSSVPVNAMITIVRPAYSGDRCIRYTALLRNETGHHYADSLTGDAAREQRIVPLKVEPPANVQVTEP